MCRIQQGPSTGNLVWKYLFAMNCSRAVVILDADWCSSNRFIGDSNWWDLPSDLETSNLYSSKIAVERYDLAESDVLY